MEGLAPNLASTTPMRRSRKMLPTPEPDQVTGSITATVRPPRVHSQLRRITLSVESASSSSRKLVRESECNEGGREYGGTRIEQGQGPRMAGSIGGARCRAGFPAGVGAME